LNLSQMTVFLVGYNGAGISGSGGFLSLVPIATGVDWNQQNAITYNYSATLGELYTTYNFNASAFNQNYTSSTNPILFGHVQTGVSITLYQNGSSFVNSTLNVTPGTTTGFSIGARFQAGNGTPNAYLYGPVNEVLIFSQAISTTQRQQVEGYLAWKWGLQGSLPSNHPYKTSPIAPLLNPPTNLPIIRSSQWQPTQISGCGLWYDGKDASTVTLISGAVSSWRNKGLLGSSFTMLQANPTNRPIYSGENGLVFNSNVPNTMASSTIPTFSLTANTFAVFTPYTTGRQRIFKFFGNSSVGAVIDTTFPEIFGNQGNFYYPASIAVNTRYLYSLNIYSTTSRSISVNFTENTSLTPDGGAGPNISFLFIGGEPTVYFNGIIHEIIVISDFITISQRQNVEGYLAWKWGLVASLPSSHPFKLWPPPP
jgi:hypothetical protein